MANRFEQFDNQVSGSGRLDLRGDGTTRELPPPPPVLPPRVPAPAPQQSQAPATLPPVNSFSQFDRPAPPNVVSDVAKSFGAGVRTGVEGTGGMFGDAAEAGRNVADLLIDAAGLSDSLPDWAKTALREAAAGPFGQAPTTGQITEAVTDPILGADRHQPETTAGEFARTIGEFTPGLAAGPGGVIRRGVSQVAIPAVTSEIAGQVTEGTAAEPYARVAGAVAGGAATGAVSRAVTPFPGSAAREKATKVLKRNGVEVTAGQRTGSRALRFAEDELGGGAIEEFGGRQRQQFTRAALRRAGVDADNASPEVLNRAFREMGQEYEALSARNSIVADQDFVDDLLNAVDEYNSVTVKNQRAPVVKKMYKDIVAMVQSGGVVAGDFYQHTRSRLVKMAKRVRNSDPEKSEALDGIRRALDDAMGRSIELHNPDDAGLWQNLNRRYANLKTIEKAAGKAGETAAEGILTPSALKEAVGRQEYARGRGDLADLSRAGVNVMSGLSNSGTAGRHAARNLGVGLTTLLGAGGGSSIGGSPGAMVGAAAGFMAPRVAGAALLSGPGRAYAGNQIMSPLADLGQMGQSALISGLLARNPQ